MNMIYKNQPRSASNDSFVRPFSWLLCFVSLRERFWYLELLWSLFSSIRTEYREIVHISPYSVKLQVKLGSEYSKYRHFLISVCLDFLLNTPLYCNNIESHIEKKQ